MKKHYISAIVILAIFGTAAVFAAIDFKKMYIEENLKPSKGLTEIRKLSYYFKELEGTIGDTEVYVYDSGVPGGTAFLAGGTHPNEPAGYIAPVLIMENIKITKGRFFIIPRLNNSAFTHTDPMEGYPLTYPIETKNGERRFRVGSRLTNPLHQWPDPLVFSQYPSNQQLSGFETRNLNRAFPGRSDGNYTEKVAYAVVQLLKKEHVDVAFDLHESSPEVPIVNVIIYHEKCEETALGAVLGLEMHGLVFSPEISPENFHGLSHREWGDYTGVSPFLMETSNPAMGRLRGETSEELIKAGISEEYQRAKDTDALRIVYRDSIGEPLTHRVGRHVVSVLELLISHNMNCDSTKIIEIENIPEYAEIMEKGLGEFLNN